jgi:hypothetical protein
MDVTQRRELARRALDGYVSGPGATTRATDRAVSGIGDAATVVLVEGISDQIAVETAASGQGRDLAADRVRVVPIGGAHAIRGFLVSLGDPGAGLRLVGLCDLGEEDVFRRGLAAVNGVPTLTRAQMEEQGFFVCVDDLEDELVRAVGTSAVEALFDAQGDLASYRSLQRQPAWRGRDPQAQMRRFLGSGSRRKLRYARLLVDAALVRDALPRPLASLLAAV